MPFGPGIVGSVLGASASAATTSSIATYGAKCDGVTDDTAVIQRALNAAAAAGGGTVTLPGSTCLLNSFRPSSHPWGFYNLHVPSGVTLQGVTGFKLLQGPGGRQSINKIPGTASIGNTVVTVGNNYAVNAFQSSANSGFYSLQAMTVGSPLVTLSTAAQAANFAVGDCVAIYQFTSGDVLPAQMSQVTGVNVATGELTLADSVIRPFAAPSIAKVTSLAAHDIAINNVIIQGAIPLAVSETFNFSASNDEFLSDTSIGGGNINEFTLNTVEHFTFAGNRIATRFNASLMGIIACCWLETAPSPPATPSRPQDRPRASMWQAPRPRLQVTGSTSEMASVYIYNHSPMATTVASNTLSGIGRSSIYAGTRASGSGDEIYNNTIKGFATSLDAPGEGRGPTSMPRKNIR